MAVLVNVGVGAGVCVGAGAGVGVGVGADSATHLALRDVPNKGFCSTYTLHPDLMLQRGGVPSWGIAGNDQGLLCP